MKSYSTSASPLGKNYLWSTCNVAHKDIERIELHKNGQVCVLRAVTEGHKRKVWVTLLWDGECLKDRFFEYREGKGRGQTDEMLQVILKALRVGEKYKADESDEEMSLEDLYL